VKSYLDAVLGVRYAVGCDWRVMADLFGDQLRLAGIVLPGSKEEFAEEWIQGLLLASQFFIA
jgi:hypothetical protein